MYHLLSRAVIILDDHLLLAYDPRKEPKHYYELNVAFYYLPGGHIEFNESAEAAVLREIYEETGFDSSIERFLGVLEHSWSFPGDEVCCHTHEINLIFKVNLKEVNGLTTIFQKEDYVAFQWIPLKEMCDIDFRPQSLKTILPQWLANQKPNLDLL
ncbi:NUDIX domain-containing protein [Kamptonema cortianum]|nr:NUDIX domain-containing protein [Geitlerinema splendidum]MDK3161272.1 NUDIX domain-containing protein [Kamptonema cortianum]